MIRPIAVPLRRPKGRIEKPRKIKGRPVVPLPTVFFSRARARTRVITRYSLGRNRTMGRIGVRHD